jgi:hypothetical protein
MPGLDALAHVIRPAAGDSGACARVVPELTTWVQDRRASAPLP